MLAVALDDGRTVLLACRGSCEATVASNWHSLHTVHGNAEDAVVDITWHPGPGASSMPLLALATCRTVSIWCLDACVSDHASL